MSKIKVLLRADGSSNIGYGHVYRMFSLANMLVHHFDCTFCTHEKNKFVQSLFQTIGVEVINISSIPYPPIDSRKFGDEVSFDMDHLVKHYQMVVLDGYWFGSNYQKELKKKTDFLVCIDDLHEIKFHADLIINHSPGIGIEKYHAEEKTRFALGIEFALLRPAFLAAAKVQRPKTAEINVFISFGGSDPNNLTKNAAEAAHKSGVFSKIIVVLGNAYNHVGNEIDYQALQGVEIHKGLNETEMVKLMQASTNAIVPSSGILLECLAAGCQAISGMSALNQVNIYQNYLKQRLIVDGKSFAPDQIEKAIKELTNTNKTHVQAIDGQSGSRLLKLLQDLPFASRMQLRKANAGDLDLTYKWASDKSIRAFSYNQNEIVFEEHKYWFLGKIEQDSCFYLIGEIDQKPLGSIRFDVKDGVALISYLLDPSFQGRNLGQHLLSQGIYKLKESILNFQKVVGYVLKQNLASVKAFSRLGFNQSDEGDSYKFEIIIERN